MEFDWFHTLMNKFKTSKFSTWIAGFLTAAVFILFKGLDHGLNSEYIATLLRSWFLVVVFSSIFIDGIVKLIKFMGKKVDDKEDKKENI